MQISDRKQQLQNYDSKYETERNIPPEINRALYAFLKEQSKFQLLFPFVKRAPPAKDICYRGFSCGQTISHYLRLRSLVGYTFSFPYSER